MRQQPSLVWCFKHNSVNLSNNNIFSSRKSHSREMSDLPTNHDMRRRLAALDWNAKLRVNATGEGGVANADIVSWCRRNPMVRNAPIFIATTEDIGTLRCRCNHLDAGIHYSEEQEVLRLARAPL